MRVRGACLAGAVTLLAGCVYYNSIYNAERLFLEAEEHRRGGRDSLAAARYDDVVRKAARGYRSDPDGEWAAEALSLLGRARLRRGELRAARAALEEAARLAAPERRAEVLVYLGATLTLAGEDEAGLQLVNEALRGLRRGRALAEGHLWRARILLARGEVEAGWWDLDRALADEDVRTDAALERLRWAVHYDAPLRAGEAIHRLLSYPDAGARLDTIVRSARSGADQWGAATVAALFAGADSAAWGRLGRGRVRLARAELHHAAGDTVAALRDAWAVASGVGEAAAEARVRIARWRLDDSRDLAATEEVRPILLPSGQHPRVRGMLDALEELEELTAVGFDRPLGLFAAGELARDRLGAPRLARGFFVAYADAAADEPWVPKALLAAIETSPDVGDRAWLRGRLEAHPASPYVLAARGDSAPGFEELEEELARRLDRMRNR